MYWAKSTRRTATRAWKITLFSLVTQSLWWTMVNKGEAWIDVSWKLTLKMKSFHIPCKTMNTFVQVLLGYMRQSLQLKELDMYYYKATGSHGVKNTLLNSACAATVLQLIFLMFYSCRFERRCYFFVGTHLALFYTMTVHCLSSSTKYIFFWRGTDQKLFHYSRISSPLPR